jgi:hypothetical protein
MTNCEWFNSKLEGYFCDSLADQELRRFQSHLATCSECREQVESLNRIDPLVRGVLQHRLALAQTAVHANGRPRILRLGLALGSLAAIIVLFVFGMGFQQQEAPLSPVAAQPPAVENSLEPDVKKDSASETDPPLAKPDDGTPVKPAPQPELDTPLDNGPAFGITDAAGQAITLETYRGHVLLFGLVSPEQKTAVNHLEQVYEAFGSNPGIRVLAVPRHREDDFRGAKFPLFFNNGSRLLGAQEGEFVLVDASGKVRLKDSLADPASVARIRSELGQLGIR